jgi:hypothetical protein
MERYIAKAVFLIETPDQKEPGQFEEVLRLVEADTRRAAFDKAVAWGRLESTEFANMRGERVAWKFVAVSELKRLPELVDGLELDSHLQKVGAEDEFIRLQLDKQREILQQQPA